MQQTYFATEVLSKFTFARFYIQFVYVLSSPQIQRRLTLHCNILMLISLLNSIFPLNLYSVIQFFRTLNFFYVILALSFTFYVNRTFGFKVQSNEHFILL